jgi:hypothetical protein
VKQMFGVQISETPASLILEYIKATGSVLPALAQEKDTVTPKLSSRFV